MALITFLGGEATGNVGSVGWGRYTFVLNLPVECTDAHIVAKASANPFFRVEGDGVRAPPGSAASALAVEIVPDDPADDPEPVPATQAAVQPISEPEPTEEPPTIARRRGRPPKAKDA